MKQKENKLLAFSRDVKVLILFILFLFPVYMSAQKIPSSYGSYGQVSESEAVNIADLWYCMEVNSEYSKLSETEKAERINTIYAHRVQYLLSENKLQDTPPVKGYALAYIITYEPFGFVIVAGSDRIQPIIAFSARSAFKWEGPEYSNFRDFLSYIITKRWKHLRTDTHPVWKNLRLNKQLSKDIEKVTFEAPAGAVCIEWHTASWGQGQYYHDVVVANNGNNSKIPTGCTATAMAIKFRFHEWPITGNGSHSYYDKKIDDKDKIHYNHSVNFAAQIYNWDNMPVTNLTAPNLDVATLMYHCGVAVEMNYEENGSSAEIDESAIHKYFRYKGTEYVWLLGEQLFEIDSTYNVDLDRGKIPISLRGIFYDNGYTLSSNVNVIKKLNNQWVIQDIDYGQEYVIVFINDSKWMPVHSLDESKQEKPVKKSILGGLPVLCASRGHSMLIDGYRNTAYPFYHVNHGHAGDGNGWYDLFYGTPIDTSADIENSWPYCAPENYIYVDANWTGKEDGNLQTPYNTYNKGETTVPNQGHLWLKANSYSVTTITKPMTIHSYEGTTQLVK